MGKIVRSKYWPGGIILLLVLLVMAVLPGVVMAADTQPVSLEQAIRTVKDVFAIPAEFSEFSSNYNNSNGQSVWSLNWNDSRDAGGNFSADVDAQSGEILNMNFWVNEKQDGSVAQIPSISRTEARQKAIALLAKIASHHLPELQPVQDNDELLPLGNYGPATYTFRWQRVSDGVPFPENGATMVIRGDNGSITNYNLQWTKAVLPATTGVISPEQARQAFDQAGMLELIYYQPSRYTRKPDGTEPAVVLVYQLNHSSGGVVDALTGQPLEPNSAFRGDLMGGGGGGDMGYALSQKQNQASVSSTPLSPEEIKEVEKTTKLISQEEALQSVKKMVEIPDGLTLQQASLNAAGYSVATHVWNLSWNSADSNSSINRWMNVQVNAENGELLSYSFYTGSDDRTASATIDRPAAQALAEAFIKKVQPRRFLEVKLNESDRSQTPWISKWNSNQTTQYFSYRRIVNGIPFPGNSITVVVDAVNKQINSYDLNWSNLSFPAADKIINNKQAVDVLLQSQPLTLAYLQAYDANGPGTVQLVYKPLAVDQADSYYHYNLVDAKSGQMIDWQGNPVNRQQALKFDDIEGSFAAEDIKILGQAGLFGEYGHSFHPDENVTMVSLLRAMLITNDSSRLNAQLSADEIINQARSRGWIKEDVQANDTVSRLTLAQLMIRYLKLERAAHAVGVFQVPYADAGSLPEGSLPYVALTRGLGILYGDGTNFNPDNPVTRAQAAAALAHTLRVAP